MSDELIFGPNPEWPEDGTPAFRTIARDIRDQIVRGDLVDGQQLATVSGLAERYGVSIITIRTALQQLRSEGLVVGVQGKGTFVRRIEQLERAMPYRHWRQASKGGGRTYDREAANAGRRVDVEHDTSHQPAPRLIAERLGIALDDPTVMTTYVVRMDGQPVSMSTSWEPIEITGGTPIELPHEGPHGTEGIVGRFDSIGVHVNRVQELLDVDRPSGPERRTLAVPPDVSVIRIQQTFYSGIDGDQAVQTADITYASDRYRFRYDMTIA